MPCIIHRFQASGQFYKGVVGNVGSPALPAKHAQITDNSHQCNGRRIKIKFTTQIVILVVMQVILILSSFLILVHFESQMSLTGNMVNIAGKNRILGSTVQLEMYALAADQGHPDRVLKSLNNMTNNIILLKNGGSVEGIMVPPLPEQFHDDWNLVQGQFVSYEGEVLRLLEDNKKLSPTFLTAIQETNNDLLSYSDNLTDKLGHYVDRLSHQLIFLQILLCIINVMAHIIMIYFILKIFQTHAEQRIKAEKFTVIGKIASAIAHDLRNPLGTIRNSTALIAKHEKSDAALLEIQRINRAIKRMAHQIEGVLNYVRTVPLVTEPASLRDMLDGVIETLDIPDNIKLRLPSEDILLTCDSLKMEFVFANTLLNAQQAIGTDEGYIEVRFKELDDQVIISMENSGNPIPDDIFKQMFEPLFTTKMEGTGLGLTSSKNIIEQHGGIMKATAHPVTFTMYLPKHANK